ncbi:MAG TPA: ATP-binding protein [Thermoanaerobaculia bacterium]|nr:ATP-binding protein [Thermoanaerobaculia bacterium]
MYLPRLLQPTLVRALGSFPAVLVTGPRQSGKTTFLQRELGGEARYVSLDDPTARSFAREDPNGFLDRFADERVILDEIQYAPELLSPIKIRIDRDRRRNGRFILTGSQRFQLMAHVGESLAGRIALLELLPFSLLETAPLGPRTLDQTIWNGGYPEPVLYSDSRDLWLSSYLQTYVERDVRQLHQIQDLRAFELLLGLAAARHGQELNLSDLSRSVGVSVPTIKSWLGTLEASFVLRLLPPYFENFGKRLVKTPKLYLVDSALACSLTRQPSAEAALAGAMGGALFEGLIVAEAAKVFASLGRPADLSFWRTHDGLEVDLLVRTPSGLIPIEIKQTATPTARHVEPMRRFVELAGPAARPGFLVCTVPEKAELPGGNLALPWQQFPAWLQSELAASP